MFEIFVVSFSLFVLWSYGRAKRNGIPWFRVGSKRSAIRYQNAGRVRTHSIKSKSPWLHERQKQGDEGLAFKRLTALTHSTEVSTRLIMSASDKHVGHSELWYIEKAIYDIERDRMAR